MEKTCSEVGAFEGVERPSEKSQSSSVVVSPDDDTVADDENDNAGVDDGVEPRDLAIASICESADRYDVAETGVCDDFFLSEKMDGVGLGGFKAIGDGMGIRFPDLVRPARVRRWLSMLLTTSSSCPRARRGAGVALLTA